MKTKHRSVNRLLAHFESNGTGNGSRFSSPCRDRDLPAEKKMKDMGITEWETMEIPLSSIDWEASRFNHARTREPLIEEHVTDIENCMEEGDVFPMIIVLERADGKYLILSGNHRAAAVKRKAFKAIGAYVVKSTDHAVIDLLPRVLNRLNGERMNRKDALDAAIHIVNKYQWEASKAASIMCLPAKSVDTEMRVREVRSLLVEAGVNVDKVAKDVFLCLHALHNDNVIVAAGKLVIKAKMTGQQARDIIVRIKKQKTEAKQLEVVAELERQTRLMDPGPVVKVPRAERTKYIAWLSLGENYHDGIENLDQKQITEPAEQEEVCKRLETLCKYIMGKVVSPTRKSIREAAR